MKYIKLINCTATVSQGITIYIPTFFSNEDIKRYLLVSNRGVITDYSINTTPLTLNERYNVYFQDFERGNYQFSYHSTLRDVFF